MVVTSLSANYAHLVVSTQPVGRTPVGQEDSSLKMSTLKPVEQLANSAGAKPSPDDNDFSAPTGRSSTNSTSGSDTQDKLDDSPREKRKQEQERLEIASLAARDREVRAHEQAHASIGGLYAGAAQFQFQRGPDGVSYAVGGEVSIDVSRAATPEATMRKAQVVQRAALAPAEPSPQDRRVAAEAVQMQVEARQEILQASQRDTREENTGEKPSGDDSGSGIANGTSEKQTEPLQKQRGYQVEAGPELPEGLFSINSRLNASISNTAAVLQSPRQGSVLDQIV